MTVDIIICACTDRRYLAQTLESVRSQHGVPWNCWLVAAEPTDTARQAFRPYESDDRFRYLAGFPGETPLTPVNRAILQGQAPLIAFLDGGDVWMPDKLERQAGFLTRNPGVVLLGSRVRTAAVCEPVEIGALPPVSGNTPVSRISYESLARSNRLPASSVVLPRWVLRYAGLFTESLLPPGAAHHDLWLRIGVLGDIGCMESQTVISRNPEESGMDPAADSARAVETAPPLPVDIYRSALAGSGDLPSPLSWPENGKQRRACQWSEAFHRSTPTISRRIRYTIGLKANPYLPCRQTDAQWEQDVRVQWDRCRRRWSAARPSATGDMVVFSKDRALQLHALLSSYFALAASTVPVHVLYHVSGDSHAGAYDEVISLFADRPVRFVRQSGPDSFRMDLMEILLSVEGDKVFFAVDDILFVEPFDLADFLGLDTGSYVPTLRMGLNLTHCFLPEKAQQPHPPFAESADLGRDKIAWRWDRGASDWGYPLSVDGHLFDRREVVAMAMLTAFKAPNSFEDALQRFRRYFLPRLGVAYRKSKIVNIPCNRVQSERDNAFGDLHQEMLLKKWLRGYRIAYERIYGLDNVSVHQEIELPLVKR